MCIFLSGVPFICVLPFSFTGTLTWPDGRVYKGEFCGNLFEGQGRTGMKYRVEDKEEICESGDREGRYVNLQASTHSIVPNFPHTPRATFRAAFARGAADGVTSGRHLYFLRRALRGSVQGWRPSRLRCPYPRPRCVLVQITKKMQLSSPDPRSSSSRSRTCRTLHVRNGQDSIHTDWKAATGATALCRR